MQSSMQKYKKRMLTLSIMLLVIVLLSGVSYAIFTNYASQTDANTLAASCMDLDFNGQNEIKLTNTYPVKDGEALEQTPYTFTIKNKCDNYIEYYVIASVISTTNKIDSKYVKVSLLGDNDLNGTVINTLESISTPHSLSKYNITENYILKRGDGISKDESRTFNFRMWLDSSNKDIWTREDIEGKDYQVKISVVGTVKTRPKDDLFIAALIDGKESTSFPTTGGYTASVECTRNGKKIDANESIKWNGTKWALTASITDGNVRCNAIFKAAAMINFTIDGTPYQGEEGMTWEEWVNSNYNTGGFKIYVGGGSDGHIYENSTSLWLSRSNDQIYTSADSNLIYYKEKINEQAYYKKMVCFEAGTRVLMASGEYKNIENIKVGEYVMALNEKTGKYIPREVLITHKNDVFIEMIDVYFSNGIKLSMTSGHPLLTTKGWKSYNKSKLMVLNVKEETGKLSVGDVIIGINGNSKIIHINNRGNIQNNVYNLTIDGYHNFVAEGFVVHNAGEPCAYVE